MSGANMICPKCKSFQPAAQTCAQCGVFVAKLWARQADPDPDPAPPDSPPPRFTRRSWTAAAAVSIFAALGIGFWLGGESVPDPAPDRFGVGDMRAAFENALDAQQAAFRTHERLAEEVFAAETGALYRIAPASAPRFRTSETVLNRLAGQLNSIADHPLVTLEGEDLRQTYQSCADSVERYFRPLRYGSAQTYPLAPREEQPYVEPGLDGRFRCEGTGGWVYLMSPPRTRDGLTRCWAKHTPRRLPRSGGRREASPLRWVGMQWDEEVGRWAIYTRAEQRTVDRARLKTVEITLDADIIRRFGRREDTARQRLPTVAAAVEATREKLRVLKHDANRDHYSALLRRHERELKDVLVEQRYTRICQTAAQAALEEMAASL